MTRVASNPFLPKGVHYVTQAGLFGSRSSIRHITRFLENHGSVTPIVNPKILLARGMQKAKTWFSRKVDSIRKDLARSTISLLAKELQSRKEIEDKKQFVREYYSLRENSDLSIFIERYVLNLFDKRLSRFPERIFETNSQRGNQISDVVRDCQEGLSEDLHNTGLTLSPLHRRKITNRVFDMLSPRIAVLWAHSQGGLTALQSMQEENNDIAMVLGWGMPTNGVNPDRIPVSWLLKRICPLIGELMNGSPELVETANKPCPVDMTVVAIESKGRKDGVVLPNNFPLHILNAHHVEIGPRKAKATKAAYFMNLQ